MGLVLVVNLVRIHLNDAFTFISQSQYNVAGIFGHAVKWKEILKTKAVKASIGSLIVNFPSVNWALDLHGNVVQIVVSGYWVFDWLHAYLARLCGLQQRIAVIGIVYCMWTCLYFVNSIISFVSFSNIRSHIIEIFGLKPLLPPGCGSSYFYYYFLKWSTTGQTAYRIRLQTS